MHGIHRTAGRVGGDRRKQGGVEDAEAHLLAFHVAGRLHAERLQARVARRFRRPADEHPRQKDHGHGPPHRPAVALVLDHAPEVVGQPARDQEDRQHLDEVGKRRRVLVRVRGVGVHEAAAVGAEHLDRHLRGHRPLGDGLSLNALRLRHRVPLGILDGFAGIVLLGHVGRVGVQDLGCLIGFEVLDHALRHQEHGIDDADGQQHVQGDAHDIGPEVADGLGGVPGDAAHQSRRHRDPHRGGDEVVEGQPDHLGKVRGRGFPAVALPVGVGREAHRRVEGQVIAEGVQAPAGSTAARAAAAGWHR